MILFTIKKTFFDIWDNLLSIFLLNFGCLLVVGLGFYAIRLFSFHPVAFGLGVLMMGGLFFVYIGVTALFVKDIANYQSPEFKKFLQYAREVWKAALVFMLTIVMIGLIFTVIFPFYWRMGNILGILAGMLLLELSVLWLLASQYYFPVRSRLDTDSKKVLRKSLLLCFDNTGFTLVLGLGTLLLLILSGFTAFLFPGIGAILLWHQVGLKLRLYKYTYLEEHPEAKRQKIPWDTLLQDERERVGPRTLRGMIFPWKE
jgi:uncharacterized membrane protein YesL